MRAASESKIRRSIVDSDDLKTHLDLDLVVEQEATSGSWPYY